MNIQSIPLLSHIVLKSTLDIYLLRVLMLRPKPCGISIYCCPSFPCYTDLVCSLFEVELRPYTPAACLVGMLWAAYKVEVAVVLVALLVPARVRQSLLRSLMSTTHT